MRRTRTHAFTLIELILVMGLLAMVIGFCAPALSSFLKGRGLKEESRRFLALTRYARSEAASRAVPMELWIETETGAYGLEPSAGFSSIGDEPEKFKLDDGLKFEIEDENSEKAERETILFQPDGSIDVDSVEALKIVEDESRFVRIARAKTLTGYEVGEDDEK